MQKVVTAEEMREIDRLTTERYGIPSILLMENAAHAAARVITEKLGGEIAGKSFLILCGKGNNGGDGAALARILWTQGAQVSVQLFGKVENSRNDSKVNLEIIQKIFKETYDIRFFQLNKENFNQLSSDLSRCDVVVDAMIGTGLHRSVTGIYRKAIQQLNRLQQLSNISHIYKIPTLFSLDLPTGLNADSSEIFNEKDFPNDSEEKNIKADLTVTFTAPKIANVLPPASNFNGELIVANIGSPQELIDNSPSKLFLAEKIDAQNWLHQTEYTNDSYKNKRGHALLIVGSREYTGAAILAGNAAMLSGVGLTTVATSVSAQPAIAAKILEEVITRSLPETKNGAIAAKAVETVEKLFEKIDVVGIGCGLGQTGGNLRVSNGAKPDELSTFVREIVTKRKTPIVIDADALNALSPFDLQGSEDLPLILTPHEGEFLRLLGTKDKDAIKDRVKAVRDFAEKHKVILVLKGERVLIGAPDGRVVINPTGNSGLGKAGNGDTLTGIITGFIAQAVQMKVDVYETVVAAVYISSLAGDIAAEKFGKRSMLASDVRECLAEAFESIANYK